MADSATTKAVLVNRALRLLGQSASYTIDAEDEIGSTCDMAWESTEALVHTVYDWSVSRRTDKLQPLSDTPNNGWRFGFALPGDRIGEPIAILDNVARESYLREFMIEQGKVYTNTQEVWARVRVPLNPENWDRGFQAAFVFALGGFLAVPLIQDEQREEALLNKAFGADREQYGGGLFGKLIALNRAAQPQGRGFMDRDPLTSARYG